ncbi:type II toxin-antitoxin system VapC family toxin [Halobaculum magnesiiphilum]|uniref:Ribonuclease VapC n=1 Tax=Halobaculum magnesiiphilum TaxID=1017351 RepID=A0A8T8W8R0_9EURY|nr:PIN domain-containing protein [Halobaculum magnesiiphilum]QZP36237.1 PIN domain-containing protein [Halobaculum magnesiiphilum]
MPRVAVDSNVVIAARLSRDQNHDRAVPIVGAVDRGELPTAYVPSDVLVEVCNYIRAKATHDAAVATLDALVESGGFELAYTPKADLDAGRSLFRRHEGLSLTDSVIAASMRREGIEFLYSFDDDFDAVEDITRLTTAENPFE